MHYIFTISMQIVLEAVQGPLDVYCTGGYRGYKQQLKMGIFLHEYNVSNITCSVGLFVCNCSGKVGSPNTDNYGAIKAAFIRFSLTTVFLKFLHTTWVSTQWNLWLRQINSMENEYVSVHYLKQSLWLEAVLHNYKLINPKRFSPLNELSW